MEYIEVYGRTPDGKTHRSLRVDNEGRAILAQQITETFHPFAKGPLTSNGVQYCTEYTTTAALNTYETVEEVRCNTMLPGYIQEMELGLTGGFAATSNATADVMFRWQARSVGAPESGWVTLDTPVPDSDIGTTIVESTRSGRYGTTNANGVMPVDMSRVPIDLRCQIQCTIASEGQGKTKNSSYARITYIPD